MRRRSLCGWLSVASIALLASPAHAQEALPEDGAQPYPPCDGTPTEGDVSAAKGAFQAGQAAFNEADYPRAITYWEDAYRRDCTAHALLLNLSRAYELNEQPRHAVTALEAYNERTPHTAQTEQNERRIQKLRERINAEEDAAAAAAVPEDPESTPVTKPKPTPTPVTTPSDTEPQASSPSRPIWPLFVAGGGAAIGIAGGVWWLSARGAYNGYLDDNCPPTPESDGRASCASDMVDADGNIEADRAQELKDAEIPPIIVASVGGAVMAAGVILYFVLPPEGGESAQRAPLEVAGVGVTPNLGVGYAGVSVDGAF